MKANYWLLLFSICGIANIAGEGINNDLLANISKPLLMPLLGAFAYARARESGFVMPKALIGALFFSWLGDAILISGAFVFGLVAFLIAHVFYIALNLRGRPIFSVDLKTAIIMTPLLLFSGYMLSQIAKTTPIMMAPVSLYSTILCALFYTGLIAAKSLPKGQAQVLMAGIVLFIFSDSLIAINRFIAPFETSGIVIMATYIIAQYLLVRANLRPIADANLPKK